MQGDKGVKTKSMASVWIETVFLTAIKRLPLIGILLLHCGSHYKGRSHIAVKLATRLAIHIFYW